MTSAKRSPAGPTVFLSTLLKHAVIDAKGQSLGDLADAIVALRGDEYPLLTGLAARVGSVTVFVPMSRVTGIDTEIVGGWVTVIIGVIFITCVLVFRRGIVGELAALQSRR